MHIAQNSPNTRCGVDGKIDCTSRVKQAEAYQKQEWESTQCNIRRDLDMLNGDLCGKKVSFYSPLHINFFFARTQVCLVRARSDEPDHADSLSTTYVSCAN